MKRTRSAASGNLYDATKDLERSEQKIAELAYIAGLDPTDLDTVTIDELIQALRAVFPYTSPVGISYNVCATDFIRQENFHLVIQARKYWWYRQLAKGAQSRG
jgi:hypothetical protein